MHRAGIPFETACAFGCGLNDEMCGLIVFSDRCREEVTWTFKVDQPTDDALVSLSAVLLNGYNILIVSRIYLLRNSPEITSRFRE